MPDEYSAFDCETNAKNLNIFTIPIHFNEIHIYIIVQFIKPFAFHLFAG